MEYLLAGISETIAVRSDRVLRHLSAVYRRELRRLEQIFSHFSRTILTDENSFSLDSKDEICCAFAARSSPRLCWWVHYFIMTVEAFICKIEVWRVILLN